MMNMRKADMFEAAPAAGLDPLLAMSLALALLWLVMMNQTLVL